MNILYIYIYTNLFGVESISYIPLHKLMVVLKVDGTITILIYFLKQILVKQRRNPFSLVDGATPLRFAPYQEAT